MRQRHKYKAESGYHLPRRSHKMSGAGGALASVHAVELFDDCFGIRQA